MKVKVIQTDIKKENSLLKLCSINIPWLTSADHLGQLANDLWQLAIPALHKYKSCTAAMRATCAVAACIGNRPYMPAHMRSNSLFQGWQEKKTPTEQELGAQCSGEAGWDSNVSLGKYVY